MDPRRNSSNGISSKKGSTRMKNLYVGNLAFSTTEEQIREMFQPYGAIEKINVVRDQDSGQPRGFAFVEMNNDEEAGKSIAGVNGSPVGGRALIVNEARPKVERARKNSAIRSPSASSASQSGPRAPLPMTISIGLRTTKILFPAILSQTTH